MEDPKNTETLAAQNEALAAEVVEMKTAIEALTSENEQLAAEVAELRGSVNSVAKSVDIAPPQPKALERPTFKMDKKTYRFKAGAFIVGTRKHVATDVVADKTLLKKIFEQYPGIYEAV